MEKMEQDKLKLFPLLDLPTVVIEEILLNLNLRVRKNLRLTCKRLYELCNSSRICKEEKIIWRKIDESFLNVQPTLLTIGRSYYNLVIDRREYGTSTHRISNLQRSIILEFFEVNGAKIRSLVLENIYFINGFLEPLIISCEDLRSLTLSFRTLNYLSSLDYFTLEPNSVTRPTVTYLELILPEHQPSKYFHRMLSVFPNVKQLKISLESGCKMSIEEWNLKTAQECSAIFDDIMECGRNLESLHLNIPLSQLIAKGSQFSEALSNLKDLSINFDRYETLNVPENFYSCFSNLTSLSLVHPRSFLLKQVLEKTQLNYLEIISYSCPILLNKENFKALVSSKLKIVCLVTRFEGLPKTVLDFPLVANRTVTDLHLKVRSSDIALPVLLFSMYFFGLVHLSIEDATDEILQYIFQYQQNLRSLEIENCIQCSKEGFCGSKDGRLKYSINNLQQLKHLSIDLVSLEIIVSDEFKDVFEFPSLEYLRIDCVTLSCDDGKDCNSQDLKVSSDLFKHLTHLRALQISDIAMPSDEMISSLFINLKNLNYLRFNVHSCGEETYPVIFINSKEFSINIEDYNYNSVLGDKEYYVTLENNYKIYYPGFSCYDKELDRMVILNNVAGKDLCSPKISSYEIDWILA